MDLVEKADFRSFCLFMDRYCTQEFIADNPELWYRFNDLRKALGETVVPQQLEFDFGARPQEVRK